MKQMKLMRSFITALLVCLVAFAQTQCAPKDANQSPNNDNSHRTDNGTKQSSNFKTWSIRAAESGGVAGMCRAFTINSEGTIIFEDCQNKASAEMKTDNPEAFAQIGDLLRRLDLASAERKAEEKQKCEGCTDQVNSSFTIKLDDREYNPNGLNLSSSQTSDYKRLLSIYREIREKNEETLRIRAAERQTANAVEVTPPLPAGLRFEIDYRPWYIEGGALVEYLFKIQLLGEPAALNRIKSVEYRLPADESKRPRISHRVESEYFLEGSMPIKEGVVIVAAIRWKSGESSTHTIPLRPRL